MTEKKKRYKLISRMARAQKRAQSQTKTVKEEGIGDISALLAEARRRQAGPADGGQKMEVVEYKGGGGLLTSMRGGFQDFVGQGDQAKKKKTSVLDVLLWIATIAAFGYFIYKRFLR